MNKKLLLGIALITSVTGLVGCNQGVKDLSEEQKTEIRNEILLFSPEENGEFADLDKLVSENIQYFTQEQKDEIIETYIDNLYLFASDLSDKLYFVGYELEDVVEQYKIDIVDHKTYKKIPDSHAMVRGLLEELKEEGFTLESEGNNSGYYVVVDLDKVLSKFGNHMSKSLKSYLEFNVFELTNDNIIDYDKSLVNLEEVANRIITLEKGLEIDKAQNYQFVDKWTSSLEEYYNILFGMSHDYFVSSDYLKADIFKEYKALAEKHKDTQLAEMLNKVINILEDNGKNFDEVTKEKIRQVVKSIYTEDITNAINRKYPENLIEQIEEDEEIVEESSETSIEQEIQ